MCHESYRECADLQLSPVCFIQVFYFVFCLFRLGSFVQSFLDYPFGMWVVYHGLWLSLLWSLNKLFSFIENKKQIYVSFVFISNVCWSWESDSQERVCFVRLTVGAHLGYAALFKKKNSKKQNNTIKISMLRLIYANKIILLVFFY